MYLEEMAIRAERHNNFNGIRLMAALGVLACHSFALATGEPDNEPLHDWLGLSLGNLCVVVFFIISGYLTSHSLLSRANPVRFVVARAARIYPALIVVVVLTALGGGALLSSLAPKAYFADSRTYQYLLMNLAPVLDVQYTLPGVFEHVPFNQFVNGSLWTIKFEPWMYVLLLAGWLVTAGLGHQKAFRVLALGLLGMSTVCYWQHASLTGPSTVGLLPWLMNMFFVGVAARLFRSCVPMHLSIALAVAVLFVALMYCDLGVFKAAYPFCIAYLVLFGAYGLPALNFMQRHDYSYGLYLYAFPVQQCVATFSPGASPLKMTLLAAPITLALAVASWHLIEKPALAEVDRVTTWLQTALRMATSWIASTTLVTRPPFLPSERRLPWLKPAGMKPVAAQTSVDSRLGGL